MQNLSSQELLSLSRKESNGRKRLRLLAVSYFKDDLSRTEISHQLKVARSSVNKWVSNYLNDGLTGLDNKPISGRPNRLSEDQIKSLADYINEEIDKCNSGGRLTGQDLCNYIKQNFGIKYHRDHVYKLLKKIGYSWITSRSRHPKQLQKVQDLFKNL